MLCLGVMSMLAACGGQPTRHASYHRHYSPGRYYPPPGPASDPWGPYIREASGRFGLPEQWIRAVMRQESGGQEDVISWAGAMGLMQVMPDTYDDLRGRYNLGDDPFDPHNNILAGTAYLREMYDRYGAPGFLAAYNAGPNRLDRYLSGGTPLPEETVSYVASIAPRLGPGTPFSGPLAVYAGGATVRYAAARTPSGCDPDAAYDPGRPCAPARPAFVQQAVLQTPPEAPRSPTPADCDPDAAYDPAQPCKRRPESVQEAFAAPPPRAESYQPPIEPQPLPQHASLTRTAPDNPRAYSFTPAPAARPYTNVAAEPVPHGGYFAGSHARPIQESMTQPAVYQPVTPPPPPPQWAIQVGAYPTLSAAEAAADNARAQAPDLLARAKVELPATAPLGTRVAFRARLSGLTASAAADACSRLEGVGVPCITVRPTAP
jgi:hypothetical protein